MGFIGVMIVQAARAAPAAPLQRGLAIGLAGFFLHSIVEQTFFEAVAMPSWWIALGVLTALTALHKADADDPPRASRPDVIARRARWAGLWLPLGAAVVSLVMAMRLGAADLWAAQGALVHQAGRLEAADAAFDRAQRWDPWTSRFPLERGRKWVDAAKAAPADAQMVLHERAEAQFARATVLSPWLGSGWFQLGNIRWELGKADEAVAAMQEAVRRDPNSRLAHLVLARMLQAQGDLVRLQSVARRLQQLEPSEPDGWMLEAMSLQSIGANTHARRLYESLLGQRPNYVPALLKLGEILEQGAKTEAVRVYQRVLALVSAQGPVGREVQRRLQRLLAAPTQGGAAAPGAPEG